MAYNKKVDGMLVKNGDGITGYFNCNVDIPDSWAGDESTVNFDNGTFDGSTNKITYKSTNIDFPSTIGDLPADTPCHNHALNNYGITLSQITATCTVVVMGQNSDSGQKSGTVTNSTPKIGNTR